MTDPILPELPLDPPDFDLPEGTSLECEDCGDMVAEEIVRHGTTYTICPICWDDRLREIAEDRAFESAREEGW